jgi:WD40 repeat protein
MLTMANHSDKLWLIAENREIREFDQTNDIISSHFTSNCTQLILGCADGKIRVISLDAHYIEDFTFDTLNSQIPTFITVSDDGQNLVCA